MEIRNIRSCSVLGTQEFSFQLNVIKNFKYLCVILSGVYSNLEKYAAWYL